MAQQNLVKVNVYSKGRIPWLNIVGPRIWDPSGKTGGLEVSPTIYRLLKQDPNVEIYLLEEDPRLVKQVKKVVEVVEAKVEVQIEIQEVEEKVEEAVKEKIEYESIDEIIEQRLNELPDEPEFEPTPLTDEDVADEPTEETRVNHNDDIAYTVEQLSSMTKAQMKQILLDRGHENDQFTGRYHDTVEILIEKVLKTQ
jgi:hypothetical protein